MSHALRAQLHIPSWLIRPIAKFGEVDLSSAPQYIETNVLSLLYLIQPALPHLRRSNPSSSGISRVVFVSSGASTGAYQGWGMYCLAKAAMNSLCRTLAVEEKENGVACWAVRPGVVNVSHRPIPIPRWTQHVLSYNR